MLLNDRQIKQRAAQGMIHPFEPALVRRAASAPVISYGLSSAGYDIRLGNTYAVFRDPRPWWKRLFTKPPVLDVKNVDPSLLTEVTGASCIVPPNGCILSWSVERFRVPDDILCVVLGKSTYARVGLVVNTTPGEPGWEGHWTLELSNTTPLPVRVYAGEGIAQVLFYQLSSPPETTYSTRGGKYQNQGGHVVLPRL